MNVIDPYLTPAPLKKFRAQQVANGWLLEVETAPHLIGEQFVFSTLEGLAEWLKAQVRVESGANPRL